MTAIELLLILATAAAALWAAVGIADARTSRRSWPRVMAPQPVRVSPPGLPQQKHLLNVDMACARADGGRHRRHRGDL